MSEQSSPVIELKSVAKSFGAVKVLTDVNFVAYSGQVTALVGDNGAGKSTLIKGIAGVQPYDSGTIHFEGKEVQINAPMDASGLGIEVVDTSTRGKPAWIYTHPPPRGACSVQAKDEELTQKIY